MKGGGGREAQKVRDILAAADVHGANIAELGVAANHIRVFDGFSGTIIDKMILGTIHIAIGKNTTFEGGTVYSNIHHDAVSGGMTLQVDKTTIIQDGKFMLDERRSGFVRSPTRSSVHALISSWSLWLRGFSNGGKSSRKEDELT